MEQNIQPRACPRSGYQYQVQPGDTLESIATNNATTVEQIVIVNPTLSASSTLLPGIYICIPPQDTVSNYPGLDEGFLIQQQPETNPGVTITPSLPNINITVNPGTTTTACPIGYQARVIGAGQTYADLLIENNISYQAMQQSNPRLNPSRLVAGTRYCAPPSGARQSCNTYRTYRMQDGENLAMAAQRQGTTPGRLLMLNPTMLPTDFSSGALICVP